MNNLCNGKYTLKEDLASFKLGRRCQNVNCNNSLAEWYTHGTVYSKMASLPTKYPNIFPKINISVKNTTIKSNFSTNCLLDFLPPKHIIYANL